jgi:hypothetical protein
MTLLATFLEILPISAQRWSREADTQLEEALELRRKMRPGRSAAAHKGVQTKRGRV